MIDAARQVERRRHPGRRHRPPRRRPGRDLRRQPPGRRPARLAARPRPHDDRRRAPGSGTRPTPTATPTELRRSWLADSAGHGLQTLRDRAASQRPRRPGTTSAVTAAPTSMVRLPSASAVQWKNSSVPSVGPQRAVAPELVEGLDRRLDRLEGESDAQWTILEIGSSMMSEAPWSSSAGISVLISRLGTTVSTAKPPSPCSVGDRRRLHRREQLDHRVEVGARHVELHQHLAPRLEGALEQRADLAASRAACPASAALSGLAISSV